MNNRFLVSYVPGETPIHRLNGATKVAGFLIITVYISMTFDVRVMLPMFLFCIGCIVSMRPNYGPIRFMFWFLFITVGVVGSLMMFFVTPDAAIKYVGQDTVIARFTDRLYLSKEWLWYAGAMFFKRLCSFSSAILFALAITPSELAAGLNKVGLPYKVCTIVSLAFRTIPDVARDFVDIKNSMQMRGLELDSKRVSLFTKLKGNTLLLVPLLISSFAKVENIANSMDLRGYGKHKKRTWYSEHAPTKADYVARAVLLVFLAFSIGYIVYKNIYPSPYVYWCPWV